jgi:hypothetical protein
MVDRAVLRNAAASGSLEDHETTALGFEREGGDRFANARAAGAGRARAAVESGDRPRSGATAA